MRPLPPGSRIGIVGTGQLGRMLAGAAAKLGFETHVFGPDEAPPAAVVAASHCRAAYDDHEALARFAGRVDVATYEFENIPPDTVRALAERVPVRPDDRVLAVCQDRLEEKRFLESLGARVAPYAPVDDAEGASVALGSVGGEGILKTRRFGYDGKGQLRLAPGDDAAAAWIATGVPAIMEGLVPFTCEVSQVAARGVDGATAFYDLSCNHHQDGVLRTSTVPAGVSEAIAEEARALTRRVLETLGYVGVLTVEFFVTPEGLVANEVAPRVHNSGHWTEEACLVSQFEQHVRAVAGWPLGDPSRHSDAVMTNLLGPEAEGWHALASEPGAAPTLYGKREPRPGRKMGHVTRLGSDGKR